MYKSTGENTTDKELIDKALINDPTAFRMIIKQSERMVAQIVFKMIADPEERKDLAQEIYLKAFRNLAKFKYESRLSTWICQISYNTCIDHLRKMKVRPVYKQDLSLASGEDAVQNAESSFVSDGHLSDTILTKKELTGILKSEVEKLSPVYQTLITLFHNEEMSYGEIGQITGLPAGTIKSYLSRARKTLRDNLLMNYSKRDL